MKTTPGKRRVSLSSQLSWVAISWAVFAPSSSSSRLLSLPSLTENPHLRWAQYIQHILPVCSDWWQIQLPLTWRKILQWFLTVPWIRIKQLSLTRKAFHHLASSSASSFISPLPTLLYTNSQWATYTPPKCYIASCSLPPRPSLWLGKPFPPPLFFWLIPSSSMMLN